MFPVFQKVRENARRASCGSNEKQLALGVLMYAQDYDELLPPTAYNQARRQRAPVARHGEPVRRQRQIRLCPVRRQDKANSYGLNEMTFVDLTDDPHQPTLSLAAFQTPSDTLMLGELGVGQSAA